MELVTKKCIPCEAGTPPLEESAIKSYLSQLKTEWEVIDNNPEGVRLDTGPYGARKIKKQFKFKNFKEAMAFINKVAELAEGEGHHPDIYIFYNKVTIELWTHAVGGLSENDFIVAAKVDNLIK